MWCGKRWVEDDTGEITRLAKATVRSIYTEAQRTDNDDRRRETVQWAIKSENEKRIKAMIELAQSEPGIPIRTEELDTDPYLINCQNGTLDLESGKLLPHRRENLITKIIPVEWKGLDYKSNLWEGVLLDWTGNDNKMKEFLQRAVGYSITGDTSEEVLFFIHGPTASGKSTFIEAVKTALGDYTKTADFEAFLKRTFSGGARNDIARLAGSRIVISIEVDKGKRLAEGLIKMITGGDTVTSRFLYHEAFEFKPTFALWLVANDAPDVDPDDDAMWRRILRIPFEHSIPKEKQDKNVKKMLRDPEAGSAILAWVVDGCMKWQKDGLKVPEKVIQSTEAYRSEVDPLRAFFKDACVINPNDIKSWESTIRLYNAYHLWANNSGEAKLDNNKPLLNRLRSLGCIPISKRENGNVSRGWAGVKINDGYRVHWVC